VSQTDSQALAGFSRPNQDIGFERIFWTTPVGVVISDPDGRILRANARYQEIVGYTGEELAAMEARDLTYPDDAESAQALFLSLKNGEITEFEVEKRHLKKDGGIVWCTTFISPVFDMTGCIEYIIAIIQDITERKSAEKALMESERDLRMLLNNVTDYVLTVGRDGTILSINRTLPHLTEADVVGTPCYNFIPAQFHDDLESRLAAAFDKFEAQVYLIQGEGPDGTISWYEGRILPIVENGEIVKMFMTTVDITERRAAETARQESEGDLRILLSNITDYVLTVDQDGIILSINRTLPQLSESDVVGASCYNFIPETFHELLRNNLSAAFNTFEPQIYEIQADGPDGTMAWYEGRILPLVKDDKLVKVFLTSSDITDRKRVEEGLRRSRKEVEVLVQQKTAELEQELQERQRAEAALAEQATELARSNRDLQQFAHVASHDLQEPLRTVGSFAKLLNRAISDGDMERATESATFISASITRMQKLIQELLEYSGIETSNHSPAKVSSDIALDRTLVSLTAIIQESGAEITRDPLPAVYADETQLALLLQNLISNAIRFRREDKPTVHVSAERRENAWAFSVEDNGIGIEDEHSEVIFDLFKRLHGRDSYEGFGLGLAICRRIVDRHQGKIWVESKPGSGSTFYFSIPDSA
jgi:PAS domain S-box-containing protein